MWSVSLFWGVNSKIFVMIVMILMIIWNCSLYGQEGQHTINAMKMVLWWHLGAEEDWQEWFYLKACLCWIASKGWLLTHFKHFNSRNYVTLLFSEFSSRMFFLCQDIIQQPAPYLSVSIYTFAGKDIMQRYKVKYNPKHCQQRYDANYNWKRCQQRNHGKKQGKI